MADLEQTVPASLAFEPRPPELVVGDGLGAVDIRVEAVEGTHVKSGNLVLDGHGEVLAVNVDPVTRRFRADGLAAGNYEVRAAAGGFGVGRLNLTVRDGDVTRASLRLDGSTPDGRTELKLAIAGTDEATVALRLTNVATGEEVAYAGVPVENGVLTVPGVACGNRHVHVDAVETAGCLVVDVGEPSLMAAYRPPAVVLAPVLDDDGIHPGPWPDGFDALVPELGDLAEVLLRMDIRDANELAGMEPEELIRRAEQAGEATDHARLVTAVGLARRRTAALPVTGKDESVVRLGPNARISRSYAPRSAGKASFAVDLGWGKVGRVEVEGPTGILRHEVEGRAAIGFEIRPEDLGGKPYRVTVTNESGTPISARLALDLAGTPSVGARSPVPISEVIESILQVVAEDNPGLATALPDELLFPESLGVAVDRARAVMRSAGVCSIGDLGRLRLESPGIIRPGVYLAPASGVSVAPRTLPDYQFSAQLPEAVQFYRPNQVRHDLAVVLAQE